MSSRNSIQHTVSTNLPQSGQVGDEAFDPKTNKYYKLMAVDGTKLTWTPIYTPLSPPPVSTEVKVLGTVYGSTKLQGEAGAGGVVTVPSVTDTLVTRNTSETLTNKRVVQRVDLNVALSGSISPNIDVSEQCNIIGINGGITVATPTGTPTNGQKLVIRIKDNGTSRTIAWSTAYRVIGTTLSLSTTANKNLYVGCIYNQPDGGYWDVVAVTQEA